MWPLELLLTLTNCSGNNFKQEVKECKNIELQSALFLCVTLCVEHLDWHINCIYGASVVILLD